MTDLPEPTVQPTRYEVSLLPEDDINASAFAITVEYRGGGWWAVTRMQSCLGIDGTCDHGIKEYGCGQAWFDAHRFDLDTALKLAKEAAPHITVNGYTVAEALARQDTA